jgi:prophage DNA circulation protein
MTKTVRTIPWLFLLLLLPAGIGCNAPQNQSRPVVAAEPPDPSASGAAAKRFQDTPLGGRTAVESAIELSEKYARLSDQTVTLREENQRLVAENETRLQEIAALEAKLKQTQKELGEANDLLIEMLSELNTWKTNILGFRTEMRDAARAQLEALLKVLEVLGGEAEAGSLSKRHEATLRPEQYDMQTPTGPTMSVAGEANEPR